MLRWGVGVTVAGVLVLLAEVWLLAVAVLLPWCRGALVPQSSGDRWHRRAAVCSCCCRANLVLMSQQQTTFRRAWN